MKNIYKILLVIVLIYNPQAKMFSQSLNEKENIILKNWSIKSSLLAKENGEKISEENYIEDKWFPAVVPTTVLSAIVKNGVYPNPRLDMNNYLLPDASDEFNAKYDLAKYSYLPGKENPWKDPYWFRTSFNLPKDIMGKHVWLNFNGINYRADVWINGKKIADKKEMAGMFQRFKYDITNDVEWNEKNTLAVLVYQVDHPGLPNPGVQNVVFGESRSYAEDLFKDVTLKISGGWDCAPVARDRNMGIYQDVFINFTSDVDLANPYVITDLPLPDTNYADIKISADVINVGNETQKGILKGKIDLINVLDFISYSKKLLGKMESIYFEKEIEIPANSTITVSFDEKDVPQLKIKNPHLWWPNGYGEQYLHNLKLTFENGGKISSTKNVEFGIREVTNTIKELNGEHGRVFYINGKRVFCRGGWIQPDILLDFDKKRIYDEARLLANANINMIANEDMPSPREDFMEACDKYGLMVWEVFYQCWSAVPGTNTAYYPLDHYLAIKNEKDIILRYRNYPSLVLWCAAVESTVGPDLYLSLKNDLKKFDTTRPFLATSGVLWDLNLTPYVNEDLPVGLSDDGEPSWNWHPEPFYFDIIRTVKYQMFRSELGQAAVPELNSLKKFIFNLSKDKNNPLFPLDSVWAEHGAWDSDGFAFKNYHQEISKRYGAAKDISDYVKKAQYINADGYRAMYEAANHRMWDITSGVMVWKLNDCAPSVLWQIFDWFLNPNAGYYFAKKANEPLHIQMSANDFKVSIINRQHKNFEKLKVSARVFDFDQKLKWEKEINCSLGADCYSEVMEIPRLDEITDVYFVKLELADEKGGIISSNFYWKSKKEQPDLFELASMQNPKPELKYSIKESEDEFVVEVKLKNKTKNLSFFNRLSLVDKISNEELLPTFWEDNYITLFSGEEKTVAARISKKDTKGSFQVVVEN
jgi:hypothetical protein